MSLTLTLNERAWPLAAPFRISRGVKTHANTIIITISDGTYKGTAEAVPYGRYNESVASVVMQFTPFVDTSFSQQALTKHIAALPAGALKNALDCAMWDLNAKQQQQSVAELLNTPVKTLLTAQTISLDNAQNMQKQAALLATAPLIKVKLDNENVLEKMRAIAKGAPNSQFIVDANEAWTLDTLTNCLNELKALNVVLIEQPLPADNDHALAGLNPCVPICADESCHTSMGIDDLKQRYQAINIKLDKTGGLSEAMKLLSAAKNHNLIVMVGCMVASSLAMAPAFLVAQQADFVDLDGPLLLADDVSHGFEFNGTNMHQPAQFVWGTATQINEE
jgi:L-alanine-DL-glutamate epimerase-like enolase superfamily enzyme